ncbi:MAG: 3-oxoadipate enol-lactonase [Actinomycetota bacterium]
MTVVLLGGLGTTTRMWEQQLAVLDDALPLDLPGHGEAPLDGPVDIAGIARRVLDAAPERFAFCGLSVGGMVGMWLGANAPERLEQLVLVCTGPKLGERDAYLERAALVRREGTAVVADGARERWFTPAFRDSPRADRIIDDLRAVSPEGYAACAEAVGDFDFRADVSRIAVPMHVVYGRDDPMTPADVRAALPGVEIPGAHLAPVEAPAAFNHELRSVV